MPSWSDLENFLKRDGWARVRQNGRDKIYEKTLPDGIVLRTAVSKGTGEIGKGLFNRILNSNFELIKSISILRDENGNLFGQLFDSPGSLTSLRAKAEIIVLSAGN